jgi:lysophospholipase L1-like esterase
MPVSPQGVAQVPNYWTVFGHSYFQNTYGTRSQAGRSDAIFRNLLNVDHTSFANFAVTGAALSRDTASQGGYTRILQNVVPQAPGILGNLGNAPYVAGGGAYLLCYGINDLGFNGNTAQTNSAYIQALRMAISRCRISALRDDDYTGAAGTGVITYGTGFTQSGFFYDSASGTTIHTCNTTGVNATVTITLPTDYNGEVVVLSFICNTGVNGGVVTFSGTAGVTGTLSLSAILPATIASRSPVVQRIKTLTSANAGQTIIITVTSLDAGPGVIQFDGYWLEADNPPPVLVCNTARLVSPGYSTAGYFGGMGDADVNTFNAGLAGLVAEFDGMVQIVDIDSAMNRDTTKFSSDGLHPNELGAAAISDAILAAVRRLPGNKWGTAASIQPPSPRTAAVVVPVVTGRWYTSQTMAGATGTAYTAVAGDLFAMPFEVTSGLSAWSQWCVELITSTVATAIYVGIYDDRRYAGYPQQLYLAPANVAGTPFPLTTGAGVKASPTSAGNGFLTRTPVDPGLYWLVIKIITAGTTTMRTLKGPSLFMPNLTTTGAGGTTPCGWFVGGQGTSVLPSIFPMQALFGVTAVDNVPMVGILTS